MKEYHKIQTVLKRNPETNYKTLIGGDFATPEFAFLQHNDWIFTEKVDGTNIRIMFDGAAIIFGGKTDRAQIPSNLVNRLNERFLSQSELLQKLFEDGVCLCGEGYGAKIQNGGNYRQDQDFVLFDVMIDGWWLQRHDVEDIAQKFGLDIVPIIGTGTLLDMINWTRTGFDSTWGDFRAEGIVARPSVELKTRSGARVITKVKCKDFSMEEK